jgi:hypothetical protein
MAASNYITKVAIVGVSESPHSLPLALIVA